MIEDTNKKQTIMEMANPPASKRVEGQHELIIKVDAIFGSKFQQELAETMLINLIEAWTKHVRNSHQKNSIEIKKNF